MSTSIRSFTASISSTILLIAGYTPLLVLSVNNGLALTPQLGWNNWNSLGCNVSESLLLDTAHILISSGLRDVGYNYIVLDDCWQDGRGEDGYIRVDKKKFPHGMKRIADSLHEQALLFGMYSSAGEMTCAGYEGSLDHEKEDAESFASYEVDYLKYDNCYHRGRFGLPEISFNRYDTMYKALNATGRSILYSLCNWGEDSVHTWGISIANSWRISGDIYDSFTRPDDLCSCDDPRNPLCIAPGSHCSVLNIINRVATFTDKAHPGGWNDLDMLEVGLGGMTDAEYIAHFSMWAAIKSPLLVGADLRRLAENPNTLTILNNPAVLAINQDPLGRAASRILWIKDDRVPKDRYGMGEWQIWSGPLSGGDQVVVFLNAGNEDAEMSVSLEDIFVHEGPGGSAFQAKMAWEVRDLWGNRMEGDVARKILEVGKEVEAGVKDAGEELRRLWKEVGWWNSTEMSYKEGLARRDERLLGVVVGQVEAGGEIIVGVERHGVKMFRLSSKENIERWEIEKNEL